VVALNEKYGFHRKRDFKNGDAVKITRGFYFIKTKLA